MGMLRPQVKEMNDNPFGINVHAPSGVHLIDGLGKVQECGIGWIRIDFLWPFVEAQPGSYDWDLYDDLVHVAKSRNLNILAMIGYTPAWATDGQPVSGVPRNPNEWKMFCIKAASRYPDIEYWEIWNEPNLSQFWSGSMDQYIHSILRPAANAIRSANIHAHICGPGLAHLTKWYRWLPYILSNAGSGYFDILTHHAYDSGGHNGVIRKLEKKTLFGKCPFMWWLIKPSFREVLNSSPFGEKFYQVWLTETGWASDRIGEHKQAQYYNGFLKYFTSSEIQFRSLWKVFFYELQDGYGVPKYGILDSSGSKKLAYHAYKEFIDSI
jgi:hypothetical protein